MPRNTSHQSPTLTNSNRVSLVDVSLTHSHTYSTTQLGTLQGVIQGIQDTKGRDTYLTMFKCGEYTGMERSNVAYTGYGDGRIVKSGVVRCNNPECPVCSNSVASTKVKRLSKALTQFKMDGGDLAFITITMKPTQDPNKGIGIMLELMRKLNKYINNMNRGVKLEERGLAYLTVEKTFSSKWAYTDEQGNSVRPFAYLHTHLHLVVGEISPNRSLLSTIRNIRTKTKDFIQNNGGYSIIETIDSQSSCQSQNAKLEQLSSVGFQVDHIDNTDKISSYLNKVVSQADQTALEMNVSNSKQGIGMGMNTYLTYLKNDPRNPLLQAHKKNLRTWMKRLYRRRRNQQFNVDAWVERFDKAQEERARLFLDSRGYDSIPTNSAFSMVCADWYGWEEIMVDGEWNPVPITLEMRQRDLVVFREDVDTRLYNRLHRYGMESTLEHLFRCYWFDGTHKECYDYYTKVNLGYDPLMMDKLISMLNRHSLLRGSRVTNKQHKQAT